MKKPLTSEQRFANAGLKEANEYWNYSRTSGGDRIGWLARYLGVNMSEPGSSKLVDELENKLENKLTKNNYNLSKREK